MRHIQRNDFETITETYTKLVFSICYSITKNYFDSEDLTQETFLSAYKHIATVKEDNIKAWLSQIAVNKCRDYLRANQRSPLKLALDETLELADKGPSLEEQTEKKELGETIAAVIGSLKEPYRSIAYHYYILGVSLPAYARQNGVNVKTAQTRLARARALIQQKIREEYFDEPFS